MVYMHILMLASPMRYISPQGLWLNEDRIEGQTPLPLSDGDRVTLVRGTDRMADPTSRPSSSASCSSSGSSIASEPQSHLEFSMVGASVRGSADFYYTGRLKG